MYPWGAGGLGPLPEAKILNCGVRRPVFDAPPIPGPTVIQFK